MHKHSTVILLSILVVFLSVYVLWENKTRRAEVRQLQSQIESLKHPAPVEGDMSAPGGGSISHYPNEYLLIPEFKIGFRKVDGLTLEYKVEKNEISFVSGEIKDAAAKDAGMSRCVSEWLPTIVVVPSAEKEEFGGFTQKTLADGRHVNIYGPNAPCFTEKATKANQDLATNQLNVLFKKFVDSVQSY